MTEHNYIEEWRAFLQDEKLSKEKIDSILRQVETSLSFGVPVVLDFSHLSKLLGIKAGVLAAMIYRPESFYRTFEIPKRRGGRRTIVSPHRSLLHCQKWIRENILSTLPSHGAAYAFCKGRNILQNAKNHVGNDYMIKLDLENFFDQITFGKVRELFVRVGYDKSTAFFLTSLCCLNEKIPQGASTSPMISNIVLNSLDYQLHRLCKENGINYSRYSDDMVFSSEIPFSDDVVSGIEAIIFNAGYKINMSKSKYYGYEKNKIVTGLHVTKETVRIPRRKRKQIRAEVYFFETYGMQKQLELNYDIYKLERLLGKLNFWKSIEPHNEFVTEALKSLYNIRTTFVQD